MAGRAVIEAKPRVGAYPAHHGVVEGAGSTTREYLSYRWDGSGRFANVRVWVQSVCTVEVISRPWVRPVSGGTHRLCGLTELTSWLWLEGRHWRWAKLELQGSRGHLSSRTNSSMREMSTCDVPHPGIDER